MNANKLQNVSLFTLFCGVSILLFFIFRPFLVVLSLSVVSAILLQVPHEKLTRIFFGKKSISALFIVILMFLFFIIPIFFLGVQIFQEAQNLFLGMRINETQYIQVLRSVIEMPIRQWFPGFVFDINASVGNVLVFISDNLGSLVYQTFSFFFGTFLMLLALFFFLRDGHSLLESFVTVSPLGKEITNEIVHKMHQTVKSIVRGTLFIVLIRTLCIWIVFSIFGVPNAIFWSSVGGIAGAIPGLGTAFAFIGAIIYFYLQGTLLAVLGTAIGGIIAIILVDNILTSYFFGKGLEISSLFVLFSILGGILFFGPLGFIMGPLVLSVFLSVIRVYDKKERDVLRT